MQESVDSFSGSHLSNFWTFSRSFRPEKWNHQISGLFRIFQHQWEPWL